MQQRLCARSPGALCSAPSFTCSSPYRSTRPFPRQLSRREALLAGASPASARSALSSPPCPLSLRPALSLSRRRRSPRPACPSPPCLPLPPRAPPLCRSTMAHEAPDPRECPARTESPTAEEPRRGRRRPPAAVDAYECCAVARRRRRGRARRRAWRAVRTAVSTTSYLRFRVVCIPLRDLNKKSRESSPSAVQTPSRARKNGGLQCAPKRRPPSPTNINALPAVLNGALHDLPCTSHGIGQTRPGDPRRAPRVLRRPHRADGHTPPPALYLSPHAPAPFAPSRDDAAMWAPTRTCPKCAPTLSACKLR